jgi:hypothetical protein
MPFDGMSKNVGGPKPFAILPAGTNPLGALKTSVCLTGKL